MSLVVKWSASSKAEYAELLQYLQDLYGVDAALKFMDKTDELVLQISTFPNSGRATEKERIRKSIITPQTSLLYEIYEDTIEILHFWDNRQDPEKLEELR